MVNNKKSPGEIHNFIPFDISMEEIETLMQEHTDNSTKNSEPL